MCNPKNLVAILSSSAALALAITVVSSPAFAQDVPLNIDPSASPAPASPAPAAGQAGPSASAGGEVEISADAEPENFYYGDYLDDDLDDSDLGPRPRNQGAVPKTHTVVSGDTLWDLSSYYFNDAWHWPKVWGLNPEISNPHWIYPGNIVRLRDGEGDTATPQSLPTDGGDGADDSGFASIAVKAQQRSAGFQQMAYVDIDELKDAAKVVGSVDAKTLLSTGDSIYVSYPDGKLPKVGDNFAIYTHKKGVERDGDDVGAYVEVRGELTITFAKDGKRARAVITRSLLPIERGMRVGVLKLKFGDVKAVANSKKMEGNIVDLIGPDELIGSQAAVIIDRGSNEGVEVGNRFLVLRRGDAYKKVMRPSSTVGQNDDAYPARAIGEVIVVQTSKKVCLGLVTFSIHEFGVGDKVFMRKGQ